MLESILGHLLDSVHLKLKELCTDIAVVPGGPTSVLQTFNVSFNKPFKNNVRRLYTGWMEVGNSALTPGGKIKRPSIEMLCKWVLGAWNMIPGDVIVESFKETGISNRLDGTEDHLL